MEIYQELSLLGEGGFSSVMKCKNLITGHLVAVKKHIDKGDGDGIDQTLNGELALIKQCHHENVVKLLDVIRQERLLYSVFELVESCVANELMCSILGPDTVRSYTLQLVRAVDYLHNNNIIHRDIKTENMLVSADGVVKLCDFGCAVKIDGTGVMSFCGGTPSYMAPEMLLLDESCGTPVDVWAIGITILTLATSQEFIIGNEEEDVLNDIVAKVGPLTEYQKCLCENYCPPQAAPPTNLTVKYGLLHESLAHLVEACLQMDPEQRWSCSGILEHHYFKENDFLQRFAEQLMEIIKLDEVTVFNEEEEEDLEEEGEEKEPEKVTETADETKGKEEEKGANEEEATERKGEAEQVMEEEGEEANKEEPREKEEQAEEETEKDEKEEIEEKEEERREEEDVEEKEEGEKEEEQEEDKEEEREEDNEGEKEEEEEEYKMEEEDEEEEEERSVEEDEGLAEEQQMEEQQMEEQQGSGRKEEEGKGKKPKKINRIQSFFMRVFQNLQRLFSRICRK